MNTWKGMIIFVAALLVLLLVVHVLHW